MSLHHVFASRVAFVMLACGALPVMAANCASVAGEHNGTFSAEKRRGPKELPQKIEGTWKANIDGKTCAMTGTVTSNLTGAVEVKGDYGVYGRTAKGKAFDPSNLFLQDPTMRKYQTFAFGSDSPDTNYVNIVNNDMAYWGSFVAEK